MLPTIPGHAYRLSGHALAMMAARGICPLAVAAALDGRRIVTRHGYLLYYHRRVVVVVDKADRVILTVYAPTKHEVKQELSR